MENDNYIRSFTDVFNHHLIGENKSVSSIKYNQELEILAIARKRTIELWNCKHYPHKACQFIDIPNNSLEDIVWCGNTLYSAGMNGNLYQYSIPNMDISHQVAITGGPTWCLASSYNGEFIAAGTESGNICIFDVNSDYVTFKTLFKQNSRILCLAWHKNNKILVAGSMNEVYMLNTTTGKVKTFVIELDCKTKDVSVHAVQVMDDMTIVVGDSRGYVTFLDGEVGTHISGVKSHKAPVLCVQKYEKKKVIYATGDDSSIVAFHCVYSEKKGANKWIKSFLGRCGKHSLHSMAYDSKMNAIFSAGDDAHLYRTFPTSMGNLHIESYPITPAMGYLSIARSSQCLILASSRCIHLCRLNTLSAVRDREVAGESRKLLKIHLKATSTLRWIAISLCAKYIAYIDTVGLHIYRMDYKTSTANPDPVEVKLNGGVHDCRQIQFLSKKRLITAKNNVLQILKIDSNDNATAGRSTNIPEGFVRIIVASNDGKYFAVLNNLSDIFVFLTNTLDYFRLPNKGILPTSVAFDDNNKTICVAYSNCSFVEFDMEHKKYTPFYAQFKESTAESTISKVKLPILSVCYNNDSIILNTIFNVIKVSKLEYHASIQTNVPRHSSPSAKKFKSNNYDKPDVFGKVKIIDRDCHVLKYIFFGGEFCGLVLEISREFIQKTTPMGMQRKIFSRGFL